MPDQPGEQSPARLNRKQSGRDHVDAVNQMFAEFELAYHNQFHRAWPDEGTLTLAKKYWLNRLSRFPPERILKATRQLVNTQTYLPTIAAAIEACEDATDLSELPSLREAYLEACRAPSPKAEFHWSHPAVYLAGRATGWFELANRTETQIFPLFEYHYRALIERLKNGENLDTAVPAPLPGETQSPLSSEENLSRLQELKQSLNS